MEKMGPVKEGKDVYIAENTVLGHPGKGSKDKLSEEDYSSLKPVKIGSESIIRDNTVIYSGVELGKKVETGHHVLIRENTDVEKNTIIGSGSIIEDRCEIGQDVSIQSGVYLPSKTIVEDEVFLGPEICITNDKYMDSEIEPVKIEKGAKVGGNVTLLPGIKVGKDSFIGAGSVVTKDVPPDKKVYGNPAKIPDK